MTQNLQGGLAVYRQRGLTLEQADEIIHEAKLFGWWWLVDNADCYGLSTGEMLSIWQHNDHMTPRQRFPKVDLLPALRITGIAQ